MKSENSPEFDWFSKLFCRLDLCNPCSPCKCINVANSWTSTQHVSDVCVHASFLGGVNAIATRKVWAANSETQEEEKTHKKHTKHLRNQQKKNCADCVYGHVYMDIWYCYPRVPWKEQRIFPTFKITHTENLISLQMWLWFFSDVFFSCFVSNSCASPWSAPRHSKLECTRWAGNVLWFDEKTTRKY